MSYEQTANSSVIAQRQAQMLRDFRSDVQSVIAERQCREPWLQAGAQFTADSLPGVALFDDLAAGEAQPLLEWGVGEHAHNMIGKAGGRIAEQNLLAVHQIKPFGANRC